MNILWRSGEPRKTRQALLLHRSAVSLAGAAAAAVAAVRTGADRFAVAAVLYNDLHLGDTMFAA